MPTSSISGTRGTLARRSFSRARTAALGPAPVNDYVWKRAATLGKLTLGAAAATAVAAGAAAAVGYGLWRRRSGGFDLAGKVAFVTGGSRGLGFAVARELLRQGCRVAICARDQAELDRAVRQLAGGSEENGQMFPVACDLAQPQAAADAVAAVRRHWGEVEVLVHNAGIMQVGPWERMAEDDFQRAMDLHCWAALRLAQAVLPAMIARRQGRIVNVSSIGGLVAVPHMLPYTTSKFALVGLSQGLGSEVRRHGVRVTCVCPFLTRTGSQGRVEVKGHHEREFAWFAASGSLPGFTQSAAGAARAIVRAARRGDAQVVLTLPGKLAALAHGIAPNAVAAALGEAGRFLPTAGTSATAEVRSGQDSYNSWSGRLLQPLVRRAGRNLNQG